MATQQKIDTSCADECNGFYWTRLQQPDGKWYWHNNKTNKSQYGPPQLSGECSLVTLNMLLKDLQVRMGKIESQKKYSSGTAVIYDDEYDNRARHHVKFPNHFIVPPIVFLTTSNNANFVAWTDEVTSTGFTFALDTHDTHSSTVIPFKSADVHWVAFPRKIMVEKKKITSM